MNRKFKSTLFKCFNQFNACLLNKTINYFKNVTDPKLLNGIIYMWYVL